MCLRDSVSASSEVNVTRSAPKPKSKIPMSKDQVTHFP
jgi:hypothetical protein